MSWFQDTFDPNTARYNKDLRKQNNKILAGALGKNITYKNKGVGHAQARWGNATDRSIADSNVESEALKNQYAAFQGFEDFARISGSLAGPTGEGSRGAESGRNAKYLAILAKRQDIEQGLRESYGAGYHSQLHQNAVRHQNANMAARDKLGLRPQRQYMKGERKTNKLVAAMNIAKAAVSVYAGGAALGAGNFAMAASQFSQSGLMGPEFEGFSYTPGKEGAYGGIS